MNLNPLSLLPSRVADEPEYDEQQAKAERIEFHRNHVRNGPAKFKSPTSGQIKRAQRRALDRRTTVARRKQVRAHFAAQREAATLRGNLQDVGLLPRVDGADPRPENAFRASLWLIRNFSEHTGRVVVTDRVARTAFQAGLNRYETLVRRPLTSLPEGYSLPIPVHTQDSLA